eukprot:gene16218-22917_t
MSYFWNWCNDSAVDWYVEKVLRPLVAYPNGTGLPYDGVFLDNSDGFNPRGSVNARCNAANASMNVHIRTAKMLHKVGKWPIFSSTATGSKDIRETDQLWAAG